MTARSVAVLGAGAVGSYLGGKLSTFPDVQVTLIGRPPVVEAVSANGLVIREDGAEHVSHPDVALSASEVAPCDLVLLTVRTYDVEAAIPELPALMGERGLVVAFENGVGTEE